MNQSNRLIENPSHHHQIEPINEILTRFAAKLTEAYADSSLVGNDAAMMAVLEESAAETNKILDRAGILGK